MLYITPRRLMLMMGVTQDIPSFITVLHAVAAMWEVKCYSMLPILLLHNVK